jgi:DNA polymerase III subunit alpha
VPAAFARGQKAQQDREIGQASLALFGGPTATAPAARYPEADPWPDKLLLEAEKECLGFYVSGHPLDRYESELHLYATHNCQGLERALERDEVRVGGIVAEIRERRSRSGNGRHAFTMLEDRHGRVELLVFSRVYAECEEVLKSGQPVLVSGSVRIEGDEEPRERKVVVDRVQVLTDARKATVGRVIILVEPDFDETRARALQQVILRYPGTCPTELAFHLSLAGDARYRLPDGYRVEPSDELLADVERLLGRGAVQLAV